MKPSLDAGSAWTFRRPLGYAASVAIAAALGACTWNPVVGLDLLVIGLCASLQLTLRHVRKNSRRIKARIQTLSSALWLILLASLIDLLSRMPFGEWVRGTLSQTPLRVAQVVAIAIGVALLERALRDLLHSLAATLRDRNSDSAAKDDESWIEVQRVYAEPSEPRAQDWRRLMHVLEEEIRIPLHSLREVGSKLGALDAQQIRSAAEALQEESERLDHLLQDFLEDRCQEDWESSRAHVTPVLETLLSGHRSLLKAINVRVKVQLCHKDEDLEIDRATLLSCMTALIECVLSRVTPGDEAILRTRQYAGLLCFEWLSGRSTVVSPPNSLDVDRAREQIALAGGESWFLEERVGFGVTVPLARKPSEPSDAELVAAVTV